MTVFITAEPTWGPADGITLIDDSKWNDADYEILGTWGRLTLLEYANYCKNKSRVKPPTEWGKNLCF